MMPHLGTVAAVIPGALAVYAALAAAVCRLVPEDQPSDTQPAFREPQLFTGPYCGLGDMGLLRVAPVLLEIADRKPVRQPLPRELADGDSVQTICPPQLRYPARYATTTTEDHS
jgi:hypothetical protein